MNRKNGMPENKREDERGSKFQGSSHRYDGNRHRYFHPSPHHNIEYSPTLITQIPEDILQKLKPCGAFSKSDPYEPLNHDLPTYRILFQKLAEDNLEPHSMQTTIENFKSLNISEQLLEFTSSQTLTQDELRIRWQLVSDLFIKLRRYHPNCEVYPFGSLLTQLADTTSDIDISIDLNDSSVEGLSKEEKEKVFRAVEQVLKSERKCDHLPKLNFLKERYTPIRSARVPVLRLIHRSGIQCDLSFENKLSFQNSTLLKFYLNLDPKITQFFVFIRYFGKFHGITGSFKVKNYVLILLGLTYLINKGIVPSVALLQELEEKNRKKKGLTNPNCISGWDASFYNDSEAIKEKFTRKYFSDVIKIILQFLEFYAGVDFSKVVVCPLIGELLSKEDFSNEFLLPSTLQRYISFVRRNASDKKAKLFTSSYACIQDPFVLNLNVGKGTKERFIRRFQQASTKVLEIKDGINSVLDLFIPIPDEVPPEKIKWDVPIQLKISEEFEGIFFTEIQQHSKLMRENYDSWTPAMSALWNKFAEDFSRLFFTEGLLLKPEVVKEGVFIVQKEKQAWWIRPLAFPKKRLPLKREKETDTLLAKIDKLNLKKDLQEIINEREISLEVSYPFWKRQSLTKLRREVTEKTSVPILQRLPKKNKRKFGEDFPPLSVETFNPLILEGKASEMILKEENKEFQGFRVKVFISFHRTSGGSRPQVHFRLEKGENVKKGEDVEQGLQLIADKIREVFPAYANYRLAKWLKEESPNEDSPEAAPEPSFDVIDSCSSSEDEDEYHNEKASIEYKRKRNLSENSDGDENQRKYLCREETDY